MKRSNRIRSIRDARGRWVTQLDPVAMHLLGRHDIVPAEDLRGIAREVDSTELRKRPRAALWAPVSVVLYYAGFFAYFHFFSTWKGWDPVLIAFAIFYLLFPFVQVYCGFRKARQARWTRIGAVMLQHLRCPHCAYDIRGLLPDPEDGTTVCPECGCAWSLDGTRAIDARAGAASNVPCAGGIRCAEESDID